MTAKDMKIKTFSLIEEYYPEHAGLAEDEDVLNKINGVINSVQMELMPYRKIGTYKDITIASTDSKTINLSTAVDDMYQLDRIDIDVEYEIISDRYLVLPDDYEGTFRIYYFKYPTPMQLTFDTPVEEIEPVEDGEEEVEEVEESEETITSDTYDETFTFELDDVLLEIMPYGIAADLLKMDMISGYGRYFYERYTQLKNSIDPRRTSGQIFIDGGIDL